MRNKEGNLDGIHRLVERAGAQGVDLIAFPEMSVTGYWHVRRLDRAGIEALAEPLPNGPTAELVLGWAAGTGMTIGVGLIERSPTGALYNSYLVALPDGRAAVHRKLHSFESEHISSGDTFTVFELPDGTRAGVLICWDNNLVENVRITALLNSTIGRGKPDLILSCVRYIGHSFRQVRIDARLREKLLHFMCDPLSLR